MSQYELGDMGGVSPRILELELDIDERMLDLWREAQKIEKWSLEVTAGFMRAAYGKGYCDALAEVPEERGSLVVDHGYRLPEPRPLPLDPEI